MGSKRVPISRKPAPKPEDIERWVHSRSLEETEPAVEEVAPPPVEAPSEAPKKKKRLTLDISESLHKAIKKKAVELGVPMVDMLREELDKLYES